MQHLLHHGPLVATKGDDPELLPPYLRPMGDIPSRLQCWLARHGLSAVAGIVAFLAIAMTSLGPLAATAVVLWLEKPEGELSSSSNGPYWVVASLLLALSSIVPWIVLSWASRRATRRRAVQLVRAVEESDTEMWKDLDERLQRLRAELVSPASKPE